MNGHLLRMKFIPGGPIPEEGQYKEKCFQITPGNSGRTETLKSTWPWNVKEFLTRHLWKPPYIYIYICYINI